MLESANPLKEEKRLKRFIEKKLGRNVKKTNLENHVIKNAKPVAIQLQSIPSRAWSEVKWSPVFFEQQNIRLAFFIVSGLVITLAVLVVGLHRYDPVGAWLLVPYLLWVAYAAYLNHGIMMLNEP
jgi:hypothetical protein